MSNKPTIIEYRKRTIKAMEMGVGAAAMIHPAVHRINGQSIEEVIQLAKKWIDNKYKSQYENRRAPHIGTAEEYFDAFQFLKLGPHEAAMLEAHKNADKHSLTASQLSAAAGWDGAGPANIHYGYLGRRIAEYLELGLSDKDEKYWTQAIADYDGYYWIMHPEVVDALERLNIT